MTVAIAIPLVVAAAFVEVYVSPHLILALRGERGAAGYKRALSTDRLRMRGVAVVGLQRDVDELVATDVDRDGHVRVDAPVAPTRKLPIETIRPRSSASHAS